VSLLKGITERLLLENVHKKMLLHLKAVFFKNMEKTYKVNYFENSDEIRLRG
jgi:hypothetical protein